MHVTVLPEYSAERYFLLSEIEQKSLLYLFDEGLHESLDDIKPSILGVEVVFAYILIDHAKLDVCEWEERVISFVQMIKASAMYPETFPQIIVLLEIGIAKRSIFRDIESGIQRIIDSHVLSSLGATVFVGVSDCIAACPALEKCYDVLEISSPGYTDDMMQSIAILFAESRDDLKGLDPSHEPDAVAGVFQAFISAEENSFMKVVSEIKRKISMKRPVLKATKEKSTPFWNHPMVVLLMAVVAYYFVRYIKFFLKS